MHRVNALIGWVRARCMLAACGVWVGLSEVLCCLNCGAQIKNIGVKVEGADALAL
ncbi:hypothetical protein PR003_g19450 [Phytophthora rubi]|uniref:Uncharacterized protein n=1 Tax=Phytophthora rubi TaxID=129364 RepID=A0A6A4DSR5_9STRA|nr:hypothetical protein PR002_g18437 [Phytophthora rubi]KAE9002967.1 hypothetical protein PR001_g18108 [Phytophthora rubi]KAE9313626.1 hypothetical protein PR003_g19450 [Phytophthora rubi]